MIIEFPDNMAISRINASDLENGWRDFNDYSKCQPKGNKWYDDGKRLALKVLSAVFPGAFDYVINSEHKDFKSVKLVAVTALVPDERIEDILKKYSKK